MTKPRPTWQQLADKLTTSTESLRTWRKMAGAPKKPDLAAWRTFVDRHGLNKGNSAALAALKVEIAQEELRRRKFDNAAAEGEHITVAEVRSYLAQLGARFDLLLTQKIDTELPARLVGKAIVEARAEARAVHDEIREIVNAGLSQWQPK